MSKILARAPPVFHSGLGCVHIDETNGGPLGPKASSSTNTVQIGVGIGWIPCIGMTPAGEGLDGQIVVHHLHTGEETTPHRKTGEKETKRGDE
jgi:hypothetical protein